MTFVQGWVVHRQTQAGFDRPIFKEGYSERATHGLVGHNVADVLEGEDHRLEGQRHVGRPGTLLGRTPHSLELDVIPLRSRHAGHCPAPSPALRTSHERAGGCADSSSC